MKSFIRFYSLFSLIIVLFSCSDNNDEPNDSNSTEYEITRYSNTSIPDDIVPKVTYTSLEDNFQVSAYFQNNNLGVAQRLVGLVAEDGVNNPVVTTFSPSGAVNSVYEHNPLNGEVTIENYISNSNETTYYGLENEVSEISQRLSFGEYQMNSDNNIDLMIREAIDSNLSIFESFNYEFNSDNSNNRISGAYIAAAATLIYLIYIVQDGFLETPKVKKFTKDINEICGFDERWSYASRDSQSSSFLCSQLEELIDKINENSNLEIETCNGSICLTDYQIDLSGTWLLTTNSSCLGNSTVIFNTNNGTINFNGIPIANYDFNNYGLYGITSINLEFSIGVDNYDTVNFIGYYNEELEQFEGTLTYATTGLIPPFCNSISQAILKK